MKLTVVKTLTAHKQQIIQLPVLLWVMTALLFGSAVSVTMVQHTNLTGELSPTTTNSTSGKISGNTSILFLSENTGQNVVYTQNYRNTVLHAADEFDVDGSLDDAERSLREGESIFDSGGPLSYVNLDDRSHQNLPAYRWRGAISDIEADTSGGLFNAQGAIRGTGALFGGILMAIAGFIWHILLLFLRLGMMGNSIIYGAAAPVNTVFSWVGGQVIILFGFFIAWVMFKLVKGVMSGSFLPALRSTVSLFLSALLLFVLTTSSSAAISSGNASQGNYPGTPTWAAGHVLGVSTAVLEPLTSPLLAPNSPLSASVAGGGSGDGLLVSSSITNTHCARWVQEYNAQYDGNQIVTVASNLWATTMLEGYKVVQFGPSFANDMPGHAACHALEQIANQSASNAPESYVLAANRITGGTTFSSDAAVLQPHVNDDHRQAAIMFWASCRHTGSGWNKPVEVSDGDCDAAASGAGSAGLGDWEQYGYAQSERASNAEVRTFLRSWAGAGGGIALLGGLVSVMTAAAFFVTLGFMAIGAFIASLFAIAGLVLVLPAAIGAWAAGSSKAKPMFRLLLTSLLAQAVFTAMLALLVLLTSLFGGLLSTVLSGFFAVENSAVLRTEALLGMFAPLVAMFVLSKVAKSIGLGNIMTPTGALGFTTAAMGKSINEGKHGGGRFMRGIGGKFTNDNGSNTDKLSTGRFKGLGEKLNRFGEKLPFADKQAKQINDARKGASQAGKNYKETDRDTEGSKRKNALHKATIALATVARIGTPVSSYKDRKDRKKKEGESEETQAPDGKEDEKREAKKPLRNRLTGALVGDPVLSKGDGDTGDTSEVETDINNVGAAAAELTDASAALDEAQYDVGNIDPKPSGAGTYEAGRVGDVKTKTRKQAEQTVDFTPEEIELIEQEMTGPNGEAPSRKELKAEVNRRQDAKRVEHMADALSVLVTGEAGNYPPGPRTPEEVTAITEKVAEATGLTPKAVVVDERTGLWAPDMHMLQTDPRNAVSDYNKAAETVGWAAAAYNALPEAQHEGRKGNASGYVTQMLAGGAAIGALDATDPTVGARTAQMPNEIQDSILKEFRNAASGKPMGSIDVGKHFNVQNANSTRDTVLRGLEATAQLHARGPNNHAAIQTLRVAATQAIESDMTLLEQTAEPSIEMVTVAVETANQASSRAIRLQANGEHERAGKEGMLAQRAVEEANQKITEIVGAIERSSEVTRVAAVSGWHQEGRDREQIERLTVELEAKIQPVQSNIQQISRQIPAAQGAQVEVLTGQLRTQIAEYQNIVREVGGRELLQVPEGTNPTGTSSATRPSFHGDSWVLQGDLWLPKD